MLEMGSLHVEPHGLMVGGVETRTAGADVMACRRDGDGTKPDDMHRSRGAVRSPLLLMCSVKVKALVIERIEEGGREGP